MKGKLRLISTIILMILLTAIPVYADAFVPINDTAITGFFAICLFFMAVIFVIGIIYYNSDNINKKLKGIKFLEISLAVILIIGSILFTKYCLSDKCELPPPTSSEVAS